MTEAQEGPAKTAETVLGAEIAGEPQAASLLYDIKIMPKSGAKKPNHRAADAAARVSVSIHDVASAANVSIATVSRVINNLGVVSPKTAARVQEVIKRIGYVPNPFAQGLMTRASRVLGIALPDLHGEFYSELLRGADGEARALGYHLLVSSEHASRKAKGSGAEAEAASAAKTGGVKADMPAGPGLAFGLIDGVAVMITDANNALSKEARESSLPTVVLDTDMHQKGVDSVVVDNARGTREAVEHLLKSVAPERMYFVGGPRENFDAQHRAKVFAECLAATGVAIRDEQADFGTYDAEWGRRWGSAMLAKGALHDAGVLAGNDEIAIGVLQAAEDYGVKVPDQLKLVGFDDTRLASLIRPRLSTVRVPMADVGAAAIRLLVRRIEDPEAEPMCVHMPTTLVVRDSSVGK
ncbi:MAG: LacI family DNA-binding transcriptional regulator [Phycisphaerales bacterium]|jgi:LacI family transcriptional regulator